MKETNLVLNEQSIKRHIKRLAKVLKNHDKIIVSDSLSHMDVQEIFSQALGFKNWHELHALLQTQNQIKIEKSNVDNQEEALPLLINSIKPTHAEEDLMQYLEKNLTKPVKLLGEKLYLLEVVGGKMLMPLILYLMDNKYPQHKLLDEFNVRYENEAYFYYSMTWKIQDSIHTNEFKECLLEIIKQQDQVDDMYDFSSSYEKYRNDFAITLSNRSEEKYVRAKGL
jgi:hypothetical protein